MRNSLHRNRLASPRQSEHALLVGAPTDGDLLQPACQSGDACCRLGLPLHETRSPGCGAHPLRTRRPIGDSEVLRLLTLVSTFGRPSPERSDTDLASVRECPPEASDPGARLVEPPRTQSRRGGPFRLVGLRHLEAGHVVLRNRGTVRRRRRRLAVPGVHLTRDSTGGIGRRRLVERRARRRCRLPRLHRGSRAQTALRGLTVGTRRCRQRRSHDDCSQSSNERCEREQALHAVPPFGVRPATVNALRSTAGNGFLRLGKPRCWSCRGAPGCPGPRFGNVT